MAKSEFVAREVVLISLAALLYNGVRGLIEGRPPVAFGNAERVIGLERGAGLFLEPDLQRLVTGHGWLLARHPAHYRRLRTALLASGAIGLVIFAAYPMAPPRMLPEYGFVDTVAAHASGYQVLQPPSLTNQYAAMPSFHFGWNLLVALVLAAAVRSLATRVALLLMPVLMLTAIVATANHFWLDAVAGGSIAVLALWLARPRR